MKDIKVLSGHEILAYKQKHLKKKLTISDLNLISKFADNSKSLKQIDEEVEDRSSSDTEEIPITDIYHLEDKEIDEESPHEAEVSLSDKSKVNKLKSFEEEKKKTS
jgi:hypothetical protein